MTRLRAAAPKRIGRLWDWRHKQGRREGELMASIGDVGRVADDLASLVGEMRLELHSGRDFERLVRIADEIGERADNAAQTFASVNRALAGEAATSSS